MCYIVQTVRMRVRYEMLHFLEKVPPVLESRKMQTVIEPTVLTTDNNSLKQDMLQCQAFQAVLQFESTHP